MTEEKLHATFGASSANRWISCPGSIALCEKAPKPRESSYATEGTLAHECLEKMLKHEGTDNITYPNEMFQHCNAAAAWIGMKQIEYPNSILMSEQKVDASSFTCAGQFGTLDVAIVAEFDRLVVIDFKYGRGVPVDPEENTQMIYYALGVAHEYNYNFVDVELVIIQPRAFHESGNSIRSWVITMEKLLSYKKLFQDATAEALRENAPLKRGEHCKWCPAAVICPEIKDVALREAKLVFEDEVGLVADVAPEMIPRAHLGQTLRACEYIELWIEKFRDYAFNYLEKGGKIDGFKLVEKRGVRKWKNPEKAADEAYDLFGQQAFSNPELLSPAQLEKSVIPSLSSTPISESSFYAWIKKNVEVKSSGLTIAPDTDKRPEITKQTAKEVFAEEVDGVITKIAKKTKVKRLKKH